MSKELMKIEGVNVNSKRLLIGFKYGANPNGIIIKNSNVTIDALWPSHITSFTNNPIEIFNRLIQRIKEKSRHKTVELGKQIVNLVQRMHHAAQVYDSKYGVRHEQFMALDDLYRMIISKNIPSKYVRFDTWEFEIDKFKIEMYYMIFDDRLTAFLELKKACSGFIDMVNKMKVNTFSKPITMQKWVDDKTKDLMIMTDEELRRGL